MEDENITNDEAISLSESDNLEIVESNEDIVSDDPVKEEDLNGLTIYSRDWTVETIISQIESGNIDLNPAFQRRNVWENDKRSKLIESLLVGYPVPEVVLAEIPNQKKKYVVIDGKQRLLAVHGFFRPDHGYWKGKAELKDLTIRTDLDGSGVDNLDSDDLRLLKNADLRCTILSGYKTTSILYDVFYRLNTGSVPLSMQELRNSLHKGGFSKFITDKTSYEIPLHRIMSLSGPDKRFKDIEILLKFLSLNFSDDKYSGNLKSFLDGFTEYSNRIWNENSQSLESSCSAFDTACAKLIEIFDKPKHVGRKWLPSKDMWESRFNRSLFEVLVQYVYDMILSDNIGILDDDNKRSDFLNSVKEAFNDSSFFSSVSSTTKTLEQHRYRFGFLFEILNKKMGLSFDIPNCIR